jgi:hypothetical protein
MTLILVLVGRPGNFRAYMGVTRNEAVALHVAAHGEGPWEVRVIDASVPFWVYDAEAL